MENISNANRKQKKTGVAILLLYKVNIKPKTVIRDRKVKSQRLYAIINMYEPSIKAPKYINFDRLKIESSAVTVDFNILFSIMEGATRQKINKEI